MWEVFYPSGSFWLMVYWRLSVCLHWTNFDLTWCLLVHIHIISIEFKVQCNPHILLWFAGTWLAEILTPVTQSSSSRYSLMMTFVCTNQWASDWLNPIMFIITVWLRKWFGMWTCIQIIIFMFTIQGSCWLSPMALNAKIVFIRHKKCQLVQRYC